MRWCLCAALCAPLAYAQPAPDEARAAYERGVAHLVDGRFPEAVTALERSHRLRARPSVRYNLALAYRGVGRYREAIAAFGEYLAEPDPGASPERVAAVRDERDDLRRALVEVTLAVEPAAARLRIDGHDEPTAARVSLDPGVHVFEWTADAHRPARRSLTCAPASRHALQVTLEPVREGRLVIEPSVGTASVTLDGLPLGSGRVDRQVAVGEHGVAVRARGYRPLQRRVTVTPGGVVRVVASLEREGPPGWVLPVSIGAGAAVIGAVVVSIFFATRPEGPTPVDGTWDTLHEKP